MKNDWIINNGNVFNFPKDISLPFFTIQIKIFDQIDNKNINSINDFLSVETNISKRKFENISIKEIFKDDLDFEIYDGDIYKCGFILCHLQLYLLKKYKDKETKSILMFSEYRKRYESLLTEFLTLNIDTDEQDFIDVEQSISDKLLTELNKPVYNEISVLNEVLDKPCEFKKHLTNSLNKRKKFLEQKTRENLSPQQTAGATPKLEPEETKLFEKIKKHFSFLLGNCPRKGIRILSDEKELNKLVEWTTYFYENDFQVPEISEPIKQINTNNYFTQLAFLILFDELRITGFHTQRTKAKTLFNLWESSFVDYKGYSEDNFWKVKRKNSERETKKLMLID